MDAYLALASAERLECTLAFASAQHTHVNFRTRKLTDSIWRVPVLSAWTCTWRGWRPSRRPGPPSPAGLDRGQLGCFGSHFGFNKQRHAHQLGPPNTAATRQES